MNLQNILFGVEALTFFLAFLAIVYTLGVVWRVEKKLDISYKLLLGAIIFFTLAEVLDRAPRYLGLDTDDYQELAVNGSRLIFAIFFLGGILMMRNLIRKMDGGK